MSTEPVAPGDSPLLARVIAWARADPNVRALVMTGSRARSGATVDRFSDHDLEVVAADPAPLVAASRWLDDLGDLWVCLPLSEDQPYPTRLAIYAEGRADFTVCGPERIAEMHRGLDPLYERGYRVLLDKDGLAAGLPAATGASPRRRPPSAAAFSRAAVEFWFEAAQIPKYVTRGELWVVKLRDWTMKQLLLQMIEWHALAGNNGVDVWHIGTGVADWAGPGVWEELHHSFGRFDGADSRRALYATIALYRRLGREVAEALGFDYPGDLDGRITAHIDDVFAR